MKERKDVVSNNMEYYRQLVYFEPFEKTGKTIIKCMKLKSVMWSSLYKDKTLQNKYHNNKDTTAANLWILDFFHKTD